MASEEAHVKVRAEPSTGVAGSRVSVGVATAVGIKCCLLKGQLSHFKFCIVSSKSSKLWVRNVVYSELN